MHTFWFKMVFHLGTTALLPVAPAGRLTGASTASAPPVNVSGVLPFDYRLFERPPPAPASPVNVSVFKAHRLVHHSTIGLIVIKKKKSADDHPSDCGLSQPHPGR